MKTQELREMSDENLDLTLKDTVESLFRLRLRAQTERLDAPTELLKARRTIARIKTIQTERELAAAGQSGGRPKKRSKRGTKRRRK